MRDQADSVGRRVLPGQHRDHSGNRESVGRVDLLDPRVGVGRADHDRISLIRPVDIVAEAAVPGHQAQVLHPR